MGAQHSKFSASKAAMWLACPGSLVLGAGLPDSGASKYAQEGTNAHTVFEHCIKHRITASKISNGNTTFKPEEGEPFVVDAEMVEALDRSLGHVREITANADMVLAETRVNYSKWLGVPHDDGWGTADVIAIIGSELVVMDLKYGRGVEVSAGWDEGDFSIGVGEWEPKHKRPNEQMALYALGALSAYGDIADIDSVRLVVLQPRVANAPSEYRMTLDELVHWGTTVAKPGAHSVLVVEQTYRAGDSEWESTFLRPGEDQCRWCKAKATCPALRAVALEGPFGGTINVSTATPDEFTAVTDIEVHPGDQDDQWLSALMSKADLIEDWLKAVRAEVERRLLAGQQVPGYKLVQGRQGNRAWSDKAAAEDLLRKTFRLPIEKAYDLSLISPTTAEKLVKAGDIGERQWKKAEALITRAEGKPSVAPVSDKRPALDVQPVADDFQPVAADVADIA